MKKFLLIMMCAPAMLAAQNGVAVSGLAVDAGTVTFNVSWKNTGMQPVWSDTVWVFVDYNNNGVMERLPVTSATASAGTVTKIPDNDKGVWIAGNARSAGSFSATVQLLTTVKDVGGACVYGSNYPPMGKYTTADKIEFTGTPDYKVILEKNDNSTYTATVGKDESLSIPSGEVIQSFTDKTGAPGTFTCIPSTAYTLTASASGFCEGGAGVTFSLSGTQAGRSYELYRDGAPTAVTLVTTGGAATFSSIINEPGTYTAKVLASAGYCEATMSGALTISEIPLPDNPVVFGASCACAGTVTLSASSSDALIDWYADAATTSKLYTGASYTTPEIATSTTYYAQARVADLSCLSARVPVLAEVITEGCCHAPGATGITFSAFDGCPVLNGTWTLRDERDNKTYKVKYLVDGRFWMVQDLKFGNCPAGSFTCDNSVSATQVSPTVAPGYVGHCRSASDAAVGYLYSWAAAMNDSRAYDGSSNISYACTGADASASSCRGICPIGWHLPTADEYSSLYTVLRNANRCDGSSCTNKISPWEGNPWHRAGCGTSQANTSTGYDSYTVYLTSTGSPIPSWPVQWLCSETSCGATSSGSRRDGHQVRCVQNSNN